VYSSILHPPWLVLFDSSERFCIASLCVFFLGTLTTYPCNCVSSDTLFLLHSLGPHKLLLCNSTSAFSRFSQHHLSASLPTTHHLHTLPSMPRERGKSKRGARYYNTLSRRNRLSPSQLALIAHFTSPRHTNQRSQEAPPSTPLQLHGISPVKEEASPSCTHIPPSTPHLLHGLSSVKEEAPPSCTHIPLATSLLPPPQNSIHRTPTTEMVVVWWRRKSPRASKWRKTQWLPMRTPQRSPARKRRRSIPNNLQITSRRSTSNSSLKSGRNRTIRCTLSASLAKEWTFCSTH
jgi:hypothetical protein